MEQSRIAGVTPKAEATRQRILDTALNLFVTKGYEGTTMRDIAAEAGCSLGLTYRYFARKEDLVLVLYHRLAEELEEQVRTLPRASLAERFYRAMLAQLTLLAPYRELSGPMFGSALNPQSGQPMLHGNRRQATWRLCFTARISPWYSSGSWIAAPIPGQHTNCLPSHATCSPWCDQYWYCHPS